jgi:hypothetical protein
MKRLLAMFGYTAAALTIVAAVLIPFVLINVFTRGVAATGVQIDPSFTGGERVRSVARAGYQVVIHRPVLRRSPLARVDSFVQLDWKPAAALPARVSDEIDLDGDGHADLRVTFDVPRDPGAGLRVNVTPLGPHVQSMRGAGKESFSSLIARVNDAIVVRVPLRSE